MVWVRISEGGNEHSFEPKISSDYSSSLINFMPVTVSLIKQKQQRDLRHRYRQDSDSQMADAKSTALWPRCSRAWVVVWFLVTAVTAAFATSINSSQVLYGRARPFESCSNTSAEYGGSVQEAAA